MMLGGVGADRVEAVGRSRRRIPVEQLFPEAAAIVDYRNAAGAEGLGASASEGFGQRGMMVEEGVPASEVSACGP